MYPEETFSLYETFKNKVGSDEMKKIPSCSITFVAGYVLEEAKPKVNSSLFFSKRFVSIRSQQDGLITANRETEAVTGIPFMTDALDKEAKAVLNA